MVPVHDLIIRGGTLVDGTGVAARVADVAIDSGRITDVGTVQGGATRIIEADGLLVTPGWVDVHTHYDGQVTWDPELAPSSWHGVTTLVMGNCGVGFAPAQPDRHDWLIGLMEGVEDIPGTALAEGIALGVGDLPRVSRRARAAALDGRRRHPGSPRRRARPTSWASGAPATRPATAEDIAAMRAIVLEAIRAGALGFSTSRTMGHRAIDGELVPGTFAAEDELFGIGSALGEAGAGVFELAPLGSAGEMLEDAWQEVDWMRRLSAAIDRPVSYVLLQVDDDPELWRKQLAASLEACAEGARLFPQIAGRPTGILSGHHTTLCLFSDFPAYAELRARGVSPAELATALADPEVRRRIVSWTPSSPAQADAMDKAYERTFILGDPPDYEPGPRALAGRPGRGDRAARRWRWPTTRWPATAGRGCSTSRSSTTPPATSTTCARCCCTRRGCSGWPTAAPTPGPSATPPCPRSCSRTGPATAAGATCSRSSTWCKKQTHDTARLYGLGDRGTVEPGALADFNLIDYDALTLGAPYVTNDLPAGGRRLLQKASGYVATIKAGTVTFEHGEPTGALPGRLVRGAR